MSLNSNSRCSIFLCVVIFLLSFASQESLAQHPSAEEIVIREGFATSPGRGTGGRGRLSIPKDPLEAAWLSGTLQLPDPNLEESPSAADFPNWRRIKADEQGGLGDRALASGWLVTFVDAPSDGIWLLDAKGHGAVRVNDVPRIGDLYSNGKTELPVSLQAGRNTLVFSASRGKVTARLKQPQKKVFLSQRDSTYPHILRGESTPVWGSLLLVNATNETQAGMQLRVGGKGFETTIANLPALVPLATRKIAFQAHPKSESAVFSNLETNKVSLKIELLSSVDLKSQRLSGLNKSNADASELDTLEVNLDVREPTQKHHRTFVSAIDDSIQYYAVVPPEVNSMQSDVSPGLFLSLHGAGVEGDGQAACYAPKANAYVIAPTNRRPFGFDWEDWGRWDALEVLQLASERFKTNPQRTYITGHSMGGHGTWHVGSLFPDRFAAIGPSAGWISFSTYAGGSPSVADDSVSQMLRRPITACDTLARITNLASQGIYILHGDRDDNVPVGQARTMREELAKFHPNFVYKEQPGAGHWWGNPCMDWPPMFNFFADHQLPKSNQVNKIDFATPGPNVSPKCFWATVYSQQNQGQTSKLNLILDRAKRTLSGTTTNVSRMRLDLSDLRSPDGTPGDNQILNIDLDGTKIESLAVTDKQELLLERNKAGWEIGFDANPRNKNPERCGTFKEAFRNRFFLVYGTSGNKDENDWMMSRARFDAESFWYRGNGSIDIVSDKEWRSIDSKDRSVIVYGNATINAAWKELLAESPVAIERERWSVQNLGKAESAGVLMIRPRSNGTTANVGAIGGTDVRAMRATNRLPIFTAGTGYPDLLVIGPDFLTKGVEAVQLTGYFGQDWSFENGEWASWK